MKKTFFALLAAVMLAGCAGTPIDFDHARQVRVGMTEQELTALMGPPYMVSARGKDQLWVWSHANAFGSAKSVSFVIRDGKVADIPPIPASFR